MSINPAQVIFPPSARSAQERLGSRALQERRERAGGFHQRVNDRLIAFLARVDSFFIATATADGRPYIQHRGGPKGFLSVLGPTTLGFADFVGNRQYITVGRLSENPAVCMFLIDYARPARVKVWGHASIVDNDVALLARLVEPSYPARIERAILIEIDAWDINCPQHIPRKPAAEEVAKEFEVLEARLRALETENAALKRQLALFLTLGQTQMSKPTDTVRRFYDALSRGDVAAVLDLLDPQVQWTEAESFPYYSGTWNGPSAVVNNLLIPLASDWEDFSATAHEFITSDNRVVSLGIYTGKFKKTGRAIKVPFAHVWTVRNGKLARFDMYTDTAKVLAAVTV